jgi:hypothetical protein
LPVDGGEIQIDSTSKEKKPKGQARAEKKVAKRFKIVIIRNSAGPLGQDPSHTGPWSPVSPVSPVGVPMVEAPGNEHKDPTELHNNSSSNLATDRMNSTLVFSGTEKKSEKEERPASQTPPVESVEPAEPVELDGSGNRSELP